MIKNATDRIKRLNILDYDGASLEIEQLKKIMSIIYKPNSIIKKRSALLKLILTAIIDAMTPTSWVALDLIEANVKDYDNDHTSAANWLNQYLTQQEQVYGLWQG